MEEQCPSRDAMHWAVVSLTTRAQGSDSISNTKPRNGALTEVEYPELEARVGSTMAEEVGDLPSHFSSHTRRRIFDVHGRCRYSGAPASTPAAQSRIGAPFSRSAICASHSARSLGCFSTQMRR